MHKEQQQDDNKTKEIRITQDNGGWKVVNHKGRTLDANPYTGRGGGKCGHIRTVSRVRRALAMNAAEAQLEVS